MTRDVSHWLRLYANLFRAAQAAVWPFLDLLIRLCISQAFVMSGLIKATHWDAALRLATNEYPVSWMSPGSAALCGVAVELIGGSLLALGLMTRYAAMPLLFLCIVIRLHYPAVDEQLFWIVLMGWYLIEGAGPLSIDQLLRKGLKDSALPLVPRFIGYSIRVRKTLAPLYLSVIRLWLACILILGVIPTKATSFLLTAANLPGGLPVIVAAVLLGVGLVSRAAVVLLAFMTVADMMLAPTTLNDDFYLLIILTVLFLRGPGPVSIDGWARRRLRRIYPQLDGRPAFSLGGLPRVVIVGAGFGGLSCAAGLRDAKAAITLVDRANYHLFQPLLYQVATGAITPSDIAAPIRPMFRDAFNTQVLLGTVIGVDSRLKLVALENGRQVPYDYLVLATGATHSYFGKDLWSPYAPGLKRIEDATKIRRRLLCAFEQAEAAADPSARDALLTFLVVGGGPTGVELAGAIAELARYGMEKEFRAFDPASARVLLVQSAPRILPTFDEKLACIAHRSLEGLGVEVLVGSRVEHVDANGVIVGGRHIASKTVLWAAGVVASPAAAWLNCAADAAGRIKVADDLTVPGFADVYALGDTALSNGWRGRAVPGLAPAAKQAGSYVARHIRHALDGRGPPPSFRYGHRGSLATIGRKSAVADFGAIKLWGAPAWWLWGIVHVGFLSGLRNRVSTVLNWFWAYLTFRGGVRLITGSDESETERAPPLHFP